MDNTVILAIIASLLGGSGLGAVIVNAVSNRKKVSADVVATLSKAYEDRIVALHVSITRLEGKVDSLEEQISGLRSTLSEREAVINNLQEENTDLQAQIIKLTVALKYRDKRITDLVKQVSELTIRLDEYCGPKPDQSEAK
jgi:peptidoglycan hydrolase CwlO-like protein